MGTLHGLVHSTTKPSIQRRDSVSAITLLLTCAMPKNSYRKEQSRTLLLQIPNMEERSASLLILSMAKRKYLLQYKLAFKSKVFMTKYNTCYVIFFVKCDLIERVKIMNIWPMVLFFT